MRDFRDAKAMAQTLRESLTSKAINISHSESLELVSKMLGVADWNTLSAMLQAPRREAAAPAARPAAGTAAIYPAIPIRDLVPFPTATYPLFVGREKTMLAVKQAWEREREVVLAIQRDGAVDEPRQEDLHEIGVIGQLLELDELPDGTLKVVTRASRRAMIRRWSVQDGAFLAEVAELAEVSERRVADAPELVRSAIRHFESRAAAGEIPVPDMSWFSFEPMRDAGRVADTIATRVTLPISDKYDLLATLDPLTRLERVDALVDLSARPTSPMLAKSRQRAFGYAVERNQLYATLEHLLLALIDDPHASVVLSACNAELDQLRTRLTHYLDNDYKYLVVKNLLRCRPTAAFQRVDHQAALHAQEQGHAVVTGAHALLGIFAETRSPAARLLGEHGVLQARVVELIAQGIKTAS